MATDTGDITGNQIAQCEMKEFHLEHIINPIQAEFIGSIKQKPPAYSALKYRGKPYYTYAREGKSIPIAERLAKIDNISNIKYDAKLQQIHLETLVGSGTYIRTLAEDIARSLGTLGCLSALERVYVEPWNDRKKYKIHEIKQCKEPNGLLIAIEDSLQHIEKIRLTQQTIQKLNHGIRITDKTFIDDHKIVQVYNETNIFQGVVKVENNQIMALKMLQGE